VLYNVICFKTVGSQTKTVRFQSNCYEEKAGSVDIRRELRYNKLMEIVNIVVGSLETNCYVLRSGDSAMIIDPGAEPAKIINAVTGLKVGLILATHRHYDHIDALKEAKKATGAKAAIHSLDWMKGFDIKLHDGQFTEFTGEKIKVIHTPGHTPGGCCFLMKEILFSGDTLFPDGPGNTFGSRGDEHAIYASIREKLMPLPDDTQVLPGHGPSTTIGRERRLY
jgi:hydroxyacylglutathione hydrolase